MASGLKLIKNRIKAVGNIQKITTSMKMVSAAKFLKAEKNLIKARPFGVATLHFYDLNPITFNVNTIKVHLCPVTSDRGLCGSMPTLVCKYARKALEQSGDFGLICVGEKTRISVLSELRELFDLVVNGIGHAIPTFIDASLIAEYILEELDLVYGRIIFGRYINVMNFEIRDLPVYSVPVLVTARELVKYENEDENLQGYLEFSVASLFFYALSESYVVELACRINAMNNASKNAAKLVTSLKINYNRMRQAVVTRELIDIVCGAQVVAAK